MLRSFDVVLRRALASLLVAGALACDEPVPAPSLPSGDVDGTLTLRADGRIDLDAIVRVQVYGTTRAETYALGDVGLRDSRDDVHWTVDSIESEGPWPVTVAGPLVFETRRLRIRAHTSGTDAAVHPLVSVDVEHAGETLPATLTAQFESTLDACAIPSLEPLATELGGSVLWSATTLPELVQEDLDLAVDPRGRAYLVTRYSLSTGAIGIRVLARSAGAESTFEALGTEAAIAPGSGSGPTLVTRAAGDVTITRLDAELHPVWSHVMSNLDTTYALVGASGGRLVVNVHPGSTLVIDGETVPLSGVSDSRLVLFDETTGDVIKITPSESVFRAVGLGKGAFAMRTSRLVVLDADLNERWSVAQSSVDIAVDLDGNIWVGDGANAIVYAQDGTLLKSIPTHASAFGGYWRSIAPLGDSGVLVANDDSLGLFREGEPGVVTPLPPPSVPWCPATASFRVARPADAEAGHVVVVARPDLAGPSPQRFAVIGELAL